MVVVGFRGCWTERLQARLLSLPVAELPIAKC